MPGTKTKTLCRETGELTRRQWLLRLPKLVLLMGFRGAMARAESGGASAPAVAHSRTSALLPGLYEPSSDHLSHALSSDAQFHPVPPGSETDYNLPRAGPFEPQFFSSEEFQVIRRIVELFLREASQPSNTAPEQRNVEVKIVDEIAEWIDRSAWTAAGIREAARRLAPDHRILAVHFYGAAAVAGVENSDSQKIFRDGLQWLEEESRRHHGTSFLSQTREQQVELLTAISDDRSDRAIEHAGTRFFHLTKRELVRGFYTSQAGLKELDYKGNSFYAEAPGCTHASQGPKGISRVRQLGDVVI